MNNGKSGIGYEKLVSIEINDNSIDDPKKFSAADQLRNGTKQTLKYASLVTLTVHNADLTLTMRAA